jgi:hypothetical protein
MRSYLAPFVTRFTVQPTRFELAVSSGASWSPSFRPTKVNSRCGAIGSPCFGRTGARYMSAIEDSVTTPGRLSAPAPTPAMSSIWKPFWLFSP